MQYQFDDKFNLINFLIGNTNNTGEFRIFFLIGNSYQLRFRVFFGSEGGSVLFFLIWKLCTLLDKLKFITNPQFCTLNSFFFSISANTNSSTISCFNLTLVLQAQKFCIFKSPFYSNRPVYFFLIWIHFCTLFEIQCFSIVLQNGFQCLFVDPLYI